MNALKPDAAQWCWFGWCDILQVKQGMLKARQHYDSWVVECRLAECLCLRQSSTSATRERVQMAMWLREMALSSLMLSTGKGTQGNVLDSRGAPRHRYQLTVMTVYSQSAGLCVWRSEFRRDAATTWDERQERRIECSFITSVQDSGLLLTRRLQCVHSSSEQRQGYSNPR